MVYHKISNDNRMTAIRLCLRGLDSVKDISQLTNISPASLYCAFQQYNTTGSVTFPEAVNRG
ncbi:hypothetical protein BDN71DRAFT_1405704 [Pleurotus eryngii]|uniref:Uncharacterized protein n=1 Tax=Pleurotus eryngii TaxID=5323 RepID=A0A9P5ZGQ0_PLEER|nr:hypothetical protein BDN71DRAFT_1405704 [Pleurotus eryngii]